ncbi:MAG: class I SAM-dependent methyltransferase [Dehalococcoidia bacterium]|nr:class I SAM-dependent methyltransferase [Dehalococcoidia bacterium]
MTLADKLLYRKGTCPWWFCFTFDNPVRRWLQDPQKVLQGMVEEGQTVYDIGCGMGFFSRTLAQMVGKEGRVICVDLQKEMLAAARRKAEHEGLDSRMQFQQCTPESLGLREKADFTLAFWMVHEVQDKKRFLVEIRAALKPGGNLLLVEPKIHVTVDTFTDTVSKALEAGFAVAGMPSVPMSRAALLQA